MATYSGKHFDAVIIGAGISGLVCAAYLAKAGMKVLIVEQHDKPGGYCTSFKRKGFQFDAAAHSFGSYRQGGHFRSILDELGVNRLINIKRYDPSDIIVTPDFTIKFWNRVSQTISDLKKYFPGEEKNIVNFFDFLNSIGKHEFIKLKDKTFVQLLNSFFTDVRLINSLSLPIFGNSGLPPSLLHAFTGSWIFREFLIDGGYYPDGGMQALANAFVEAIKKNKGKFIFGQKVNKIAVSDNVVKGIRIDNNECVTSKYVVSAGDVTRIYNTVSDKKAISSTYEKIKTMIPSCSFFILYIGLKNMLKELPAPGTNIWHLPHYDLDKLYYQIEKKDFDKKGMMMIRFSPDKKTIVSYINAPFKTEQYWKLKKKTVEENFLERIEKIIPKIREYIAYVDSATPQTLYKYTLNSKGAAYGWAFIPSQILDPEFQLKSPIRGLYLTGHWTARAQGIPGVAYIGRSTAKLILKKEKLR